jgi:hypothetical protein
MSLDGRLLSELNFVENLPLILQAFVNEKKRSTIPRKYDFKKWMKDFHGWDKLLFENF